MKKTYIAPETCLLHIPAVLLSGSGSSAKMEGGLFLDISDEESSAGEGRAKKNDSDWNSWDDDWHTATTEMKTR